MKNLIDFEIWIVFKLCNIPNNHTLIVFDNVHNARLIIGLGQVRNIL